VSVDVDVEEVVDESEPVEDVDNAVVEVDVDDGAVLVTLSCSPEEPPPPPPQPAMAALTASAIVGTRNLSNAFENMEGTRYWRSRNAASPTERPVDKRCDAFLFDTSSPVSECNMSRKSRPVPEKAEHARVLPSWSVTSGNSVL
jgi:hypothetical protein